tara:strand:+ start:11499 stop:11837 length:339 start_codon:yes stop_codon:yes gene_type:complete
MIAKIKVNPNYNLPLIAVIAGQPEMNSRYYLDGYLHVQGVTQAALDSALAGYDDSVDGLPSAEALTMLEQTESLPILARKMEEIIDHLENGAVISEQSKAWAQQRKLERSKL